MTEGVKARSYLIVPLGWVVMWVPGGLASRLNEASSHFDDCAGAVRWNVT